ncbi:MAG: hypothetical protein RIA65_11930 [Woeseia sp.]
MNHSGKNTKPRLSTSGRLLLGTVAATLLSGAGAVQAEAPPDGRIGYVLTYRYFAVYETEEATECPNGLNDGPRELYAKQFPDDGKVRTVMETQLKREGQNWHPSTEPGELPFYEAQGEISYGFNLDGEVGPNDFTSPDGVEGIDNELYRVLGCTMNYRAAGSLRHFINVFMWRYNNNRWMIELSDVDDLTNDDDVTVTTYRSADGLLADATGEGFVAGGTQNVDLRWGREFIQEVKGKIVDGVLTTDSIDTIKIPWGSTFNTNGYQTFRALRFNLNLTEESAEGMLAGYVDVEKFHHHLNTTWSTHHQSYGQESSSAQYPSLRRLADAYPDPETGINTAISMALEVKMTQTFVMRPNEDVNQMAQSTN